MEIRFAVKLGLAGTAFYYMKKEGIWNDSEVSLKALEKLKESSQPLLDQLKAQVPLDVNLPKLPETEQMHQIAGVYWNRGVSTTFRFLQHLPTHLSSWTDEGIDKALKNEEVKKFLDNLKLPDSSKQH